MKLWYHDRYCPKIARNAGLPSEAYARRITWYCASRSLRPCARFMIASDWFIASICCSRQTDGIWAAANGASPASNNMTRRIVRRRLMGFTHSVRGCRNATWATTSMLRFPSKCSCGRRGQTRQRVSIGRFERIELPDGHAEVVDAAVGQTITPTVHGQRLSAVPRVAHDGGVAGVRDLFDHIEFAQAVVPLRGRFGIDQRLVAFQRVADVAQPVVDQAQAVALQCGG